MSDKLFVMVNCPECAEVKEMLNADAFMDDEFKSDGCNLTLIHTYSNSGTREVLDSYGLDGKYTPVLITHYDEVIDDVENIIEYLTTNGYGK